LSVVRGDEGGSADGRGTGCSLPRTILYLAGAGFNVAWAGHIGYDKRLVHLCHA